MTRRREDIDGRVGLNKISIIGFKSISDEISLDLKPLTVLAGANSSGKSSAMQILLILKQTIEAAYDPGVLQMNGNNIAFTSVNQIFNSRYKADMKLGISLFFDADKWIKVVYGVKSNSDIYIRHFSYSDGINSFTLKENNRTIGDRQIRKIDYFRIFSDVMPNGTRVRYAVKPYRCFLGVYISAGQQNGKIFNPYRITEPITNRASEILTNTIHLPGLRGNPARNYQVTQSDDSYPGRFENYTAGIIWEWKKKRNINLKRLAENLKLLQLTNSIDAKKIDDSAIEIQVGKHMGASDMVSIADVGLGVSQVLPILVALLKAKPGQTVFIEQPEIHLHPKAQGRLAHIIKDASARGVRVVVETHSSNLLLAIQTLIAKGDYSSKDVALHWFNKTEDGSTRVTSATVENDGSFGDWPEDFDDTLLQQQDEYISAAEKRLGMANDYN